MTNHIDDNQQDTAPRLDSVSAWQDWRLKRFPQLMRRRVEDHWNAGHDTRVDSQRSM